MTRNPSPARAPQGDELSARAAAAQPPSEPGAAMREVSAAARPAAVWVAIEQLKPWSKNPRKRRPVAEVADSIRDLGWGSVIVARHDGTIIAGHTRWEAAKHLGLKEVPVRYVEVDDDKAVLLALADNKLGELADWDDDALAELLGPLMLLHDEAASVAGFSDAEIAALLKRTADEVLGANDDGPAAEASARCEIVVSCSSDKERGSLLARLMGEGFKCRSVD